MWVSPVVTSFDNMGVNLCLGAGELLLCGSEFRFWNPPLLGYLVGSGWAQHGPCEGTIALLLCEYLGILKQVLTRACRIQLGDGSSI